MYYHEVQHRVRAEELRREADRHQTGEAARHQAVETARKSGGQEEKGRVRPRRGLLRRSRRPVG
ncbi:hypothetical protein ACFV3R_05690 [Streptomyces sp. NPDC059740]|uniref:hypothetical protein n=1 Tax=Streptomyces sp. NPDC059740 TaxID=3346926 RepID=UPI003651F0E7